jgi:type VI secretion system protein VasG
MAQPFTPLSTGDVTVAAANLKALVGKLNSTCRKALEGAVALCVSRTNPAVEIEHWLFKLTEPADTDFALIFARYNLDLSKVTTELTRAIDKLKTGSSRGTELSLELSELIRESWSVASLDNNSFKIRSGYLLATLLTDRKLASQALSACPELMKIPAEQFASEVKAIVAGSAEDAEDGIAPSAAPADGMPQASPNSKTPALDQFTYDLTAQAKAGKLDAVVGRDYEIRQVIDILMRRRQNNPILTGEAGVGKTAVVEGFALRIVQGDVPPPLKGVAVRVLDLSLLQAGAGVKGEFENRLKNVIQEVKSSPTPIILFIDEAHTLIGAGGAAGSGDAANLIKPALARGELRTIAATTRQEYKKYFEGDPALKRRFQEIRVDEPSIDLAIKMMRGITGMLEKHHKVRILEEAVEDAVKLSQRYISERQLPDKSVSLLDTACAKVALSQSAVPAAVESCQRDIDFSDVEIGILEREMAAGATHEDRLKEVQDKRGLAQARLKELNERLAKEREIVEKIRELRAKLEDHAAALHDAKKAEKKLSDTDLASAKAELATRNEELKTLQGEEPLIQPFVTSGAVAEVVSGWTGIPIGKMVRNEIESTLKLKDKLAERVVGQDHALEAIAQRIRTARANLADPKRPLGVFLLVGPSGTGKTETAIALADLLYGGDRNMVLINMSEYKEEYKVSQLLGPPPGYEGSDRGGVLTEAVRRRPYSIVLLDEVEKSHSSVQEIFYQVFDKGQLSDSRGNEVNFKNTIILLTSNVGTDTIMKVMADPETAPDAPGLASALMPDLVKTFKPALVGRMTVVPFFPLSDEVIKSIVRLKLKAIIDRVKLNYKAEMICDDALIEAVASRCKEVETGARNADHILSGTLLPQLAQEFLSRMAEGQTIKKVHVSVNGDGQFTYEIQ